MHQSLIILATAVEAIRAHPGLHAGNINQRRHRFVASENAQHVCSGGGMAGAAVVVAVAAVAAVAVAVVVAFRMC